MLPLPAQNVAAWLVAGGAAYWLFVVPERKRAQEEQVGALPWRSMGESAGEGRAAVLWDAQSPAAAHGHASAPRPLF